MDRETSARIEGYWSSLVDSFRAEPSERGEFMRACHDAGDKVLSFMDHENKPTWGDGVARVFETWRARPLTPGGHVLRGVREYMEREGLEYGEALACVEKDPVYADSVKRFLEKTFRPQAAPVEI